jgi:hypothetical protein
MAWETPKTDWAAGDNIGSADFNRIENNIVYVNSKSDTIESASVQLTLYATPGSITDVTNPTLHMHKVGNLVTAFMTEFAFTVVGAESYITFQSTGATVPVGFRAASGYYGKVCFYIEREESAVWYAIPAILDCNSTGALLSWLLSTYSPTTRLFYSKQAAYPHKSYYSFSGVLPSFSYIV